MAVQLDTNGKDDLKTQFITREGTYRLMTLSEYSRPNRVGYTNNQNSSQVRVSIVSLPHQLSSINQLQQQQSQQISQQSSSSSPPQLSSTSSLNNGPDLNLQSQQGGINGGDRICFNFGKELYVYAYRGVKKAADLSKPIDKKLYKGTNPSCHDFNTASATNDSAALLVGFTTGQIQLVQPGKREPGKLYNEERLIDKTKVTCLKWLPGSSNLFLASHSSGHLYLYNEELPCTPTSPNYQTFKNGEGYTILTCKSKSTRNPLYKWTFGTDNCSINEFCFSPCGTNLAIVSQDGFLRVFHYDTMDLVGIARSYFGGFLCVCWSPDGKYIVVGGEDDLVTVWSLNERRVVARGQGHRSWVSVVAFDPYTTSYSHWDGPDFSDDENPINDNYNNQCYNNLNNHNDNEVDSFTTTTTSPRRPNSSILRDNLVPDKLATSYRLGSVSQDTHLCLWDITEDVLRPPVGAVIRHRLSSHDPQINGELNTDNVKLLKPVIKEHQDGNYIINNNNNKISGNKIVSKILSSTSTITGTSANTNINSSCVGESSANNNNNNHNKNTLIDNLNSKLLSSINSSNNKIHNNNSNSGGLIVTSTVSSSTTGTIAIAGAASTTAAAGVTTSTTTSIGTANIGSGQSTSANVLTNCIGGVSNNNFSKSDSTPSDGGKSSSTTSSKSSESGFSAFNTLTQRLSNFGFGSDKKSSSSSQSDVAAVSTTNSLGGGHHHNQKKTFTLSKISGNGGITNNHHNFVNYNENNTNLVTSLKHSKATSSSTITAASGGTSSTAATIVSTYDPMKLIGTPVCPRFDECPLLEPLVYKKIAHERLTALVFREDCFLTACQDGFIYTWARPGCSNVPQHIPSSPSAPPGGTVV